MSDYYEHDPNAVLDYSVDWKHKTAGSRTSGNADGWLGSGETITTSTWTVAAGLTQTTPTPSNVDGKTTVWLTGGTAGTSYRVTNHITTSTGRQDERSLQINVTER